MPPASTCWHSQASRNRSGDKSGPTTPKNGLNKEIRRRTDVVGIFPDRGSIIRLVGAVLAEQHDEWIEGRRYLGLDVLARSRATSTDTDPDEQEQTTPTALTA
jgi:putative transposase